MKLPRIALVVATVVLVSVPPGSISTRAQAGRAIAVEVAETAGIRRTEFPVRAAVDVPRGGLADAAHAQLRLNEAPVPAQYTAVQQWPDGTVQRLEVDFNVSLGPGERRAYQLVYGPEVTAAAPPRGLAVAETAESIQIGNARFNPAASPLLTSASYVRSEFISQGPESRNGFAIVDRTGTRHDLSSAPALKVQLLKRGPLSAVLQYAGSVPIDPSYSVPVTLTIEMPNSKSWVRMSAVVSDPARRVRDLDFDTPLALGAFPWTWDFGTPNGTYGAFRNAADAVVFTQVVAAGDATKPGSTWKVETRSGSESRLAESSAAASTSARGGGGTPVEWGHVQGATTAVAFGLGGIEQAAGSYTVTFNGQGQATYRFSPAAAATSHRFVLYQHFVSTPVPIGAATTPASMLRGLEVK